MSDESPIVMPPEAFTIPSAQYQTSVPLDQLLHSANAGVIVERVGLIKSEFRSEARMFARELAEYINTHQVGVASVYVYEETFGRKDQIHWLIHVRSLEAYETLVRMGSTDAGFRDIFTKERISPEKGGGTWDRMFVDGSLQETVLLPQFTGMYGTGLDVDEQAERPKLGGAAVVPPAQHQTSLLPEETLNSATAGILIHRVGQLTYEFRAEGRQFARDVAEAINAKQGGEVTVLLYEEAFGTSDRIHWFIHMKSLASYYSLIDMRAWMEEDVRDVYTKERISPEKGGGTWDRMFIDATLSDLALTPQHWGMYTTRKIAMPGAGAA
ncbi:DUF6039 family protein [Streptomyces sp. NPDC058374]|uniref:DUF6039 family protein n=1 Tax=unclassified Streptomyces TaxID=2593676 RepID=UPI00364B6863